MNLKPVLSCLLFLISPQFHLFGQNPGFNWVESRGTTGYQATLEVEMSTGGNTVWAGDFAGSIDFNTGPGTQILNAGMSQDVFITQLDSNGDFGWAVHLASADTGIATIGVHGMARDAQGDLYLTGSFQGTVDVNTGPGTTHISSYLRNTAYLVKLGPAGNFLWARTFSGSGNSFGRAIRLFSNGDIALAGHFDGSIDFDPGAGSQVLTSGPFLDIFVLRLDANGNYTWAQRVGGSVHENLNDIVLDGNDDIYLTGYFGDVVDFDPGSGVFNLTANSVRETYLLKLDGNGAFVKAISFDSPGIDIGYGLATDATGNVYLGAGFKDTTDFDPGPGTHILVPLAETNAFLGSYTSNLDFRWGHVIHGTHTNSLTTLRVRGGALYCTGSFRDSVDFDPGPSAAWHVSDGFGDGSILKFDLSGGFRWGAELDCQSSMTISDVAMGPDTSFWLAGRMSDTTDFDPGPAVTAVPVVDFWDAWMARYFDTDCVVDTAVTSSMGILTAQVGNASFQWLDCGNGHAPISGATSASFMPPDTGFYAVAVTQGNCTDTSGCYQAIITGDPPPGTLGVTVSPNPGHGRYKVALSGITGPVHIDVFDSQGRHVLAKETMAPETALINISTPSGLYFFRISSPLGRQMLKVLHIPR